MRSVFITASDVLTSAGNGWQAFWHKLATGHSSVTDKDGVLAAMLRPVDEDSLQKLRQERALRHIDRSALMSVFVTRLLSSQSIIDKNAACVFGSSRGATGIIERELERFLQGKQVSSATSPLSTLGGLSASVASDLGLLGPVVSLSSACATGLMSIGTAYAYLRAGLADEAVAGGSEAALTPFTFAQLMAAKVYAKQAVGAVYPYQPFSPERCGMVLGEGAAAVYLRTTRVAHDDVAILSYASAHESAGLTGISAEAACLKEACTKALAQAGLSQEDISFVVAHGAGTKKGDQAELEAYRHLFRGELPPITSSKWCVGHVLGASGVLSAIMAARMLQSKTFLPLPYDAMFASHRGTQSYRYALVTALGFGGNAVAMVLGAD